MNNPTPSFDNHLARIRPLLKDVHAILLDCDGTIVPKAEEVHEHCVEETVKDYFAKADLNYDSYYAREFKKIWTAGLGKGIIEFYRSYSGSLPQYMQNSLKEVVATPELFEKAYEDRYINGKHENVFLRTGMKDLVVAAKAMGIPVAVVSNAKQDVLEATIRNTELDGMCDLIIGKDTVEGMGFRAKPDGGSYKCAIQILEKKFGRLIDPTQCIGAEDTETGLHSLQDAGVGIRIYCDNSTPINSVLEEPPVQVVVTTRGNDCLFENLVNLAANDTPESLAAASQPAFPRRFHTRDFN